MKKMNLMKKMNRRGAEDAEKLRKEKISEL
jgi:hypothetical protein